MILIKCFPIICWPFQGLRINCLSLALNHTFCMWFWISWGDGLYGLLIWGTTIREITQLDMRYLYCWSICFTWYWTQKTYSSTFYTKHACESFSFLTFQGFFLKAHKGSVYLAPSLGRFHGNQIDHSSAFHLYGAPAANQKARSSQPGLWLVESGSSGSEPDQLRHIAPVVTTTQCRPWQENIPGTE